MDKKPDRYLGSGCPTCSGKEHSDRPLYIALAVIGAVFIIMVIIYIKYLLAKKEGSVCMAFRKMDESSKNQVREIMSKSK